MTETSRPSLLDLAFGYMPAQILATAARLGLADHLAAGIRTSEELAAATGAHQPSLYRLLRAMACLGLVTEDSPGTFSLAPAGVPLRSDVPESMRALVMLFCGAEVWRAWGELEYSVRTGHTGWQKATGMTPFEFMAQHPELAATFNAAMADHTRSVAPAIVAGYDFGRFETVVDVGGGDGTLLAAILVAAPGVRGMLFDLPSGADTAPKILADAGVADRCEIVTGDFFASVPPGADCYLLKSVIHDWDDEQATAILRNCRAALPEHGRLLVVEPVLPASVDPSVRAAVMSDLNMLVNTGGRERTEPEFRALFAAAGLDLTDVLGPLGDTNYRILEGTPSPT
jgi:orsellinic acid C2-O-methyltransferase